MNDTPYIADELEQQFEDILWSEASSMREPAESLAALDREKQDFVIDWVRKLEKDNGACAFQFLSHAHRALEELDTGEVEAWIIHALDVYDVSGLYAAVEIFRDVEGFLERARLAEVGVVLDEHKAVIERIVLGLSGRRLKLEVADDAYTDTETLFLPATTGRFDSREDNFRLLKAGAVYQWAQTRFGTWRLEAIETLAGFDNADAALANFQVLEAFRLEARIRRELPGVCRDMQRLNTIRQRVADAQDWQAYKQTLERAESSAMDSLTLVSRLLDNPLPLPEPADYHGRFFPERVEPVLRERLEDEKAGLRSLLVRLKLELEAEREDSETQGAKSDDSPFDVQKKVDDYEGDDLEIELLFHDKPVAPPENVSRLLSSIQLDLGGIPPEYLVPAGDGSYRPRDLSDDDEDESADVWSGTYHERGAQFYDEWDFRRSSYRKAWCVMRELPVQPRIDGFVNETLGKYSRHLASLRKTFEALRGEDKWLKKEPYGDEVDIDALVEAHADTHQGLEMPDRLFTRLDRVERNIAVMFMVDMSGSTNGWINRAERESLILLCEALETLGDRYAIYGFSGMTRKRCETYRIKAFDESYGEEVRGRIAGIEAKDYTRMGVAIRHLSAILNNVEAKTRILVTLSDGKPDDYNDEYRSEYGIEDTRRALIEAKRNGIHPFCITIDKEAQDYLPHMYGAVNYTIVDEVEQLPFKVSEIYRRLTI